MKWKLTQILQQYLAEDMSKKLLTESVLDMLHVMLEGEIFYMRNLPFWGMVTELAEVEDLDDSECRGVACRLLKVILGEESMNYSFVMRLHPKCTKSHLAGIKRILEKIIISDKLFNHEVQEITNLLNKEGGVMETIDDYFETQVIELLKLGYAFGEDVDEFRFDMKHTVYISEEIEKSLEKELLLKVINLIMCYEGKKPFFVQISFLSGESNVSVHV